jgi:hypothetical protein
MRRYIGLDMLAKTRLTVINGDADTSPEVRPGAITALHPTTDHAVPISARSDTMFKRRDLAQSDLSFFAALSSPPCVRPSIAPPASPTVIKPGREAACRYGR